MPQPESPNPDHVSPDHKNTAQEDLDRLTANLQAEHQKRTPPPPKGQSEKALGMRIASDFIAGIVFGLGSGYYIDQWQDTAPWGMVIMTLLGFAGGTRNAIKTTTQYEKQKAQIQKSD